MKKTFKFLPVLLASLMILVFILAACGNPDISGKVTDTDIENTADTTDAIPASPTPGAATPTPEENEYRMGSTNGGIYTNDFIGIACELDENWVYFGDEQLAELSGIAADAIGDEELSKIIQESTDSGKVVYDMYAASSDGLANISIAIENLGVVYGMALDEDKYLDVTLESLPAAFESSGIENLVIEKSSVEFAGATRPGLVVTGEISGVLLYESMTCIKQGNYMAVIALTSFNENITEQMAGLFYSIG